MKPKLSIGLSILLSLALVLFGLVFGNVRGFADERAQVNALLDGDSGLKTVLGYRASDGLNLCVVAARHLPGDARVTALSQAAQALRKGAPTLAALREADDALAAAFSAVAEGLRQSQSFAASARDTQYLARLSADFAQYAQSPIDDAYNQAVAEFNARLATPVLGDVARFFGITPCEPYAQ